MKRCITLSSLLMALIVLFASSAFADLAVGTKAPDFNLTTLDGKSFKLSDALKTPSKVLILDIWATWCGPCRGEIPYLIQINKDYADKGVKVVGIAIDSQKSSVESFAKDQKINYTVILDPQAATVRNSYKIVGIPATYIIDSKGIIRFAHSGFPTSREGGKSEAAKIESEIKTLLAE